MTQSDRKTVIITGASSGIGRSCALRLAAEGANLVLVGRNAEALQLVAPESNPKIYTCNLTDASEIKLLVDSLKKEVGPISDWLLAAGIHALRPLIMESPESLMNMWSTNVMSPLYLLGMAHKSRLISRGGSVVLFSSAAVRTGGGGQVSYAASKGAIEAITRGLAVEWASQKIRVNAIVPGVVRTPMSEKYLNKLTADQLSGLEASHLLGFGLPEDITGPALFLLSEEARWMTGSVVVVDGGYSAS